MTDIINYSVQISIKKLIQYECFEQQFPLETQSYIILSCNIARHIHIRRGGDDCGYGDGDVVYSVERNMLSEMCIWFKTSGNTAD